MVLSAAIAHRLGLLIPRLASEHDGEVVATVRAIRRTLASERLDLHDFVKLLLHPTPPKPPPPPPPPPRDEDTISWRDKVSFCLVYAERLSEREHAFLEDMKDWRFPTEKQLGWLEKIYARLAKHRP